MDDWLAGFSTGTLLTNTMPSDTGNSGSKEGKCFLVGSFFCWPRFPRLVALPSQVFLFAGRFFSQVGGENPRLYDDHQATSFRESWDQKMEVYSILYTVPFYISRLLFLVGIFRSFPYMKPVFHIHTADIKKKVRIPPILATTIVFRRFHAGELYQVRRVLRTRSRIVGWPPFFEISDPGSQPNHVLNDFWKSTRCQ